jgi:DNA gyrase subunit A
MQSDAQVAVYTTDSRCVIFSTALLLPKTTRNTQGVAVVSLKKKALLSHAVLLEGSGIVNQSRYRSRTVPAAGALVKEEDAPDKQISFEV